MKSLLATAAAALALLLGGCASVDGTRLFNDSQVTVSEWLVTEPQEVELGLGFSKQIEGEVPMLNDAEVDAYLQEIGNRIVAAHRDLNKDQSTMAFTFRATADPSVNAFAIPGGFCYVNAGLILAADNEAELVGVVAHEVAHVTQRHGVRMMLAAQALEFTGDKLKQNPKYSLGGDVIKGPGGALIVRRHGREAEREADERGVESMSHAGWNPWGMVGIFEKLKALSEAAQKEESFLDPYLSTHPYVQERIGNIRGHIKKVGFDEDAEITRPEFEAAKARVAKLMAAQNAGAGADGAP